MRRLQWITVAGALAALLVTGSANAQPTPPSPPTPPSSGTARPWAQGVTPDDQKAALQLFTESCSLLGPLADR